MTPAPTPAVETSPLGDVRERAVPCSSCHAPTWNHSTRCDACIASGRYSSSVRKVPAR